MRQRRLYKLGIFLAVGLGIGIGGVSIGMFLFMFILKSTIGDGGYWVCV